MPGGCFLTTATVEYDARPGPLRDAVAATMSGWLGVLEREVATAIEAGELPADTEPADIAFQLNALAAAASYGFQLSRDPRGLRPGPALDAAALGSGDQLDLSCIDREGSERGPARAPPAICPPLRGLEALGHIDRLAGDLARRGAR